MFHRARARRDAADGRHLRRGRSKSASGLRKVNQAFNPIFAPLVAGMTADGDQEHAAAAFSRVAQWMLWILLPLFAVMALAGSVILSIYGAARFDRARSGSTSSRSPAARTASSASPRPSSWCNGRGSISSTPPSPAVIAVAANLWLINRLGVTGAAFGILLPYVLLGILRHRALQQVFGWRNPWSKLGSPDWPR